MSNIEDRRFFISDMDIRMANVHIQFRDRMKELSIGKVELDLLELIDEGIRTSSKIAEALDKNVNSISTQLNNLRRKGYLCRKETHAESGGLEFIYYNIYEQNNSIRGIDGF